MGLLIRNRVDFVRNVGNIEWAGFQINSREMHDYARALSFFTFYFDGPAFVRHDAMDGGQAQTISLSGLFGGKERLK